ncbi:MAG TPA: hypothetical protein VKN36_15075 [Eudoraea sp.]|nr:hypothetical protein [Eudoraea sp.]
MKAPRLLKRTLITIFAVVIAACGAETVAAILFIPAFAATWNVENDNEYRIDLQPDENNKNVPAGVFEGEEQHDSDSERDGNLITGTFSGLDIVFTIHRPQNVKIQYVGKMQPVSDTDHSIVRIVLNSSEGTLILVP